MDIGLGAFLCLTKKMESILHLCINQPDQQLLLTHTQLV